MGGTEEDGLTQMKIAATVIEDLQLAGEKDPASENDQGLEAILEQDRPSERRNQHS